MSLLEQDYQEGAGVQEHYETYKNKMQLEFKFDLHCHDSR